MRIKKYPGIDYSYRPHSYWDDDAPAKAILKNIKGEVRRREIHKALAEGALDKVPEEILRDTISPELRRAVGRIHPSFMGGEYLPDYRVGEVEIARISLASTTSDVISIRARRGRTGIIRYSIADEYAGDFTFVLSRNTSRRPLTMAQMASFLHNSRQNEVPDNLIIGFNKMNNEFADDAASLRNFTRIGSVFYPELHAHCERVFDDWVADEERAKRDKQREDEE